MKNWAGLDSNQRRRKASRFTVCPVWPLRNLPVAASVHIGLAFGGRKRFTRGLGWGANVDWRPGCVRVRGMSLIRGLFWIALFIFFTFCFVVLFEYGTHDFATGFQTEFQRVKSLVTQSSTSKEKKGK
jgi:hypothetical protein